ncbi:MULTISPECIES: LysR family transcriptional regulator [unclassified Pseudomonas]|uniref:helix-turn-helix domain-containing protein n=1 Tax=unclassified Pseudomonas TaxID=196821 RepID=UPI002AC91B1B|nr:MULTISPECIES: LysR family transcriptional regulator [unclassified Pseudomonas]MEB0079971.1 LysR family transcriptional regulator [Pseudomonas sp. MH10out]MEB0170132.1 LysR family transcriptional regulator [Pseudomonas sp. CCC4.4]MEB0043605.1 LysR family transcriptional regulator [Pseudomonas sp. MH10]MEB0093988.1 LysR family transcriptional regulator [Pseudomonas sp. CCI4.2]MEB0102435.1 LysR family transcriptional regulator [Pseudomonas sp. CCI3.2]
MSDHLFSLRLFVRVARKGSFSAAGRDLNIPQPTVSRLVSALEKEGGRGAADSHHPCRQPDRSGGRISCSAEKVKRSQCGWTRNGR